MPSGICTWKKPLPLIATSSGLRALLQVALAEVARGRDRAHAEADLQAGRQLRLVAARRAGLAHVLVHQVLELGARALVAVGRDVGEVVRGVVQLGLLGLHPGLRNPQRSHHGAAPVNAAHGRAGRPRRSADEAGGTPPFRGVVPCWRGAQAAAQRVRRSWGKAAPGESTRWRTTAPASIDRFGAPSERLLAASLKTARRSPTSVLASTTKTQRPSGTKLTRCRISGRSRRCALKSCAGP